MKKAGIALLFMVLGHSGFAQQTAWERSVQKTFDEAVTLFEQQLYNPARTKFEEVLATNVAPQSRLAEESSYYRAMCALYLYNKDAEALLEDFSLNYPTSQLKQHAAWAAANYYFNKRNYRKAAEWFNKVERHKLTGTERTEYFFKLGYSQYTTKQVVEAKQSFAQAKDGAGDYAPSAKYYYAHIAYLDSNYVTALENFKPLLNDPNFGGVVPYYLSQIYFNRAEYDSLISYAEPLVKVATTSRKAEIARLLANAYLSKQDFASAADALTFYRDNGGQMGIDEHYALGYTFYKAKNYGGAIDELNKIPNRDSDISQTAYYTLADCYLKTQSKQEALAAFKAASENGTNEAIKEDARFNYAKLNYELASPYGSAVDAFQNFLKKYPNSTKKEEANGYLANLYLTTKDYEKALNALSNTGLYSKDMREAFQKVAYFRGVQLYNAVELDEARTLFKQSLQYPINQTYEALCNYWIAESYYKEEDYKSALNAFNTFENTSGAYNLTEFARARYSKAYCYFMLDDYENATTSFRLFLENKRAENNKKQDAELRLGDAYFMQRKYASAITFYNKYLAYNPKDADYALFQKALCLGLDGKRTEKISTLATLARKYPESNYAVSGQFEQGQTLLAMDKNTDALDVFNDFVKRYPQSKLAGKAWLNIGLIYRNTDQYDKSLQVFKQIVKDYPATPEANEAIGFARLIYAKQNRVDEYVEWVETIGFADVQRASLDSSMYSAGFDFYSTGNCTEAQKAFAAYNKKFPDGIFRVANNFYLGECAYKNHDDAVAEQALTRVVNEARNDYTERAIAMLASINFAKPNYGEALNYYERLLTFSEEPDQLRKARLGAMRCAVKLDNPTKALQFAEMILNDERTEPEVKSEAQVTRARSYWQMQQTAQAESAYQTVLKETKGESQAEASYYLAYLQNQQESHLKSNETIFWMIDNLPNYPQWRFKSLLIMADNYYRTGDVFQANYTLDFIIDANYSQQTTDDAIAMKEAIRRAEEAEQLKRAKNDSILNQTIIEIDDTDLDDNNDSEGGQE